MDDVPLYLLKGKKMKILILILSVFVFSTVSSAQQGGNNKKNKKNLSFTQIKSNIENGMKKKLAHMEETQKCIKDATSLKDLKECRKKSLKQFQNAKKAQRARFKNRRKGKNGQKK